GPRLEGPFNKVSLLLSFQETSMCPGECKDRMGDAFDRFGRVPIVRRTRVASSDDPAFRGRSRAPFWAAGGLVHDTRGAIVIARAQSTELRPGHEVIEARWFDGLPRDMAFRDDYLEDFRKIQAGASF